MEQETRGGSNKLSINEDIFKRLDATSSYLLGFIFADGSLIDATISSRAKYLKITNTDFEIMNDIKNVLSSNHPLSIRSSGKKLVKNKWCNTKECYTLRIGSKNICNDLIKKGLTPNKSLSMRLPKIPVKMFPHFLRGYFDGDGCFYFDSKTRRVKVIFTSGSRKFLDDIDILTKGVIGIISQNIYYSSGAYRLVYVNYEAVKLLEYMYKNKRNLYLKSKYLKVFSVLKV